MSKLSRRLDKLFLKTHVFFSAKDLLLMKDYRKAFIEASNTKAEDFKEDYKRIKEMMISKQYDKIKEMAEENPTHTDAIIYLEAVEMWEKHPNGIWPSAK